MNKTILLLSMIIVNAVFCATSIKAQGLPAALSLDFNDKMDLNVGLDEGRYNWSCDDSNSVKLYFREYGIMEQHFHVSTETQSSIEGTYAAEDLNPQFFYLHFVSLHSDDGMGTGQFLNPQAGSITIQYLGQQNDGRSEYRISGALTYSSPSHKTYTTVTYNNCILHVAAIDDGSGTTIDQVSYASAMNDFYEDQQTIFRTYPKGQVMIITGNRHSTVNPAIRLKR